VSAAHPLEVVVMTDNTASRTATVVEVRTPDTGPVLYQVAHALAEAGVTITSALVTTLGAEVVDVFYVRGPDGLKLEDQAQCDQLEKAVCAALVV
jgi:[protein-PII] uridylyltransferase